MDEISKGFIAGIMTGAVIIFVGTLGMSNDYWRDEIIKHGCGQYNGKTRAFEWINR